ncbi:aspartyl/asparaginyl beta-hydroxylase domain-containing protein [Caballeronia zhejiangensis]|uniref:aspartyl/asparaginyl beta-hydroxylase domain-containing protein n=1 Tax=Caballeronia zhejiangensis TaxID=871203 RepID=UPI001F518843|nr:aspartyl/asparaginyl beta-hydroxylase domain-containing protein [Caballeronia zhejiangensis]MCI1046934.1 aspartyl/asparaginyl beta-hydroxylase domain-containing protein [Caballeronia zhejiangensis]
MILDIQRAIRNTAAGQTTFFDTAAFPWVKHVEAMWPNIHAEANRVLAAIDTLPGYEQIQEDQAALSTDRRWKIFPFDAYGHNVPVNHALCPVTSYALSLIPGYKAGMFSILQGGKHLPAHYGPYNGVLRYHLGVTVPEPEKCGLTIGFETRRWYEGQSMIFDDSFLHSASNMSDKDRVVLFVDFERNDLDDELAATNKYVIDQIGQSYFITHAVANWLKWEEAHGQELIQRVMSAGDTE